MSGRGYEKTFFDNDLVINDNVGYSIINMADTFVKDDLFIGERLGNGIIGTNTNTTANLYISSNTLLNNHITIGGHIISDSITELGSTTNKWRNMWLSSSGMSIGNSILLHSAGNLNISGAAIITGGFSFNNSIITTNSCTIGNLVISGQSVTQGTAITGTLKNTGTIKQNNLQFNGKTRYSLTGGSQFSIILVYNNTKYRLLGAGNNVGNMFNGIPSGNYTRFVNIPLTGIMRNTVFTNIDVAWNYIAALDRNSKMYTWGRGGEQTTWGIGATNVRSGSNGGVVDVTTIIGSSLYGKKIKQIAYSTLAAGSALDSDGKIHVWGDNFSGQLGVGYTSGYIYNPQTIATMGSLVNKTIVKLINGDDYGIALDSDGNLHGWGISNRINRTGGSLVLNPIIISDRGSVAGNFIKNIGGNQLLVACVDFNNRVHILGGALGGISSIRPGSLENKIPVEIDAGRSGIYILDSDGELHSLGGSQQGALGYSTASAYVTTPVNISNLSGSSLMGKKVIAFGGGREHGLAIDQNGNLHSWGGLTNNNGQIGDGTVNGSILPQQVNVNTRLDFTGQHKCYVNFTCGNTTCDLSGLIVVADTNHYFNNNISINESLPTVSISNKPYDKRVFGVVSNKYVETNLSDLMDLDKNIYNEYADDIPVYYINSVGEGAMWVIDENGEIESGDYITTSSVPGYGMRQSECKLSNYTVAKSTIDCNFNPVMIDIQRLNFTQTNIPNWQDDFQYYNDKKDDSAETNTYNFPEQDPELLPSPIKRQVKQYKLKYINENGDTITETEYNDLLNNNQKVYKAAFIGCTYHCG